MKRRGQEGGRDGTPLAGWYNDGGLPFQGKQGYHIYVTTDTIYISYSRKFQLQT